MYKIVWGLLYCLLSIAVTNLITNFTKTAMGVLKPHFLQVIFTGTLYRYFLHVLYTGTLYRYLLHILFTGTFLLCFFAVLLHLLLRFFYL